MVPGAPVELVELAELEGPVVSGVLGNPVGLAGSVGLAELANLVGQVV